MVRGFIVTRSQLTFQISHSKIRNQSLFLLVASCSPPPLPQLILQTKSLDSLRDGTRYTATLFRDFCNTLSLINIELAKYRLVYLHQFPVAGSSKWNTELPTFYSHRLA